MRVDQDGQLGLPEHVDEARGHDHSVRVDGAAWRLRQSRLPIAAILAVTNADVAGVPGRARAIDDAAIADDSVVGNRRSQEQSQQEAHEPV